MGITVSKIGDFPLDRNCARIEISCENDNPDTWPCVVHTQDAIYASEAADAERLTNPTFGTFRAAMSYGDLKNEDILDAAGNPTGMKVSDAFPIVKGIAYALLRKKMAQKPGTP